MRVRQITIANWLQKHVVLHFVSALVGTTACNFKTFSCSPPTTSAQKETQPLHQILLLGKCVESYDFWDQHVAMEPAGNLTAEIPHTLRTGPRALRTRGTNSTHRASGGATHNNNLRWPCELPVRCMAGLKDRLQLSAKHIRLSPTPFQSEAWSICSKPIVGS